MLKIGESVEETVAPASASSTTLDLMDAEIPISCDGETPLMEPEDIEDEGTFDEFEFEDELLEEAEGYFTKELPSNEPEPEGKPLEVKLEKSVCSSNLPLEQC
ncbi:10826_t:CDS:2 [Cetraspora pellucida]|uniref:10826_t:CDS:1 n=1 Tax=Cetraspora pellucida TaxID=1433469 RepID=A0ACA9M1H7_9GLOM|nr:10826_t:CDS:2 [Cetraspora pellucida]